MSDQKTKDMQAIVGEIQHNMTLLQTDIDAVQLKGLSREQRQIRNIAYDCIQRAHAIVDEIDLTNKETYPVLWTEVNSLISTLYGAIEMLIDDFKDRDMTSLKHMRQLTDETLTRIERLRAQAR